MLLCSSCHISKEVSRFSTHPIELGMDKAQFIRVYGTPYSQTVSKNEKGELQEILFYKETLIGVQWCMVTTSFTFINSKLIKQEFVKEEQINTSCDCNKYFSRQK